jgi:hypothetical protein
MRFLIAVEVPSVWEKRGVFGIRELLRFDELAA